jgi:tRNA threonylcarbamoyladenosine biosynthesis protein TsaE
MEREINSLDEMMRFGRALGAQCRGGEVIELVGDIGAGKTTLTKGIAAGMQIDDDIQSPTFTLSRTYTTMSGITLAHYDFYRLSDPGLLSLELQDAATSADTTTVVEWADTVQHVLPKDRVTIQIDVTNEDGRHLVLRAGGPHSRAVLEGVA